MNIIGLIVGLGIVAGIAVAGLIIALVAMFK